MRLLLWTAEDPASLRLAGALVGAGHFQEAQGDGSLRLDRRFDAALARIEGSLLTADFVSRALEATAGATFERALFLSKHSAASGTTAFTVHPIGNLGEATALGGAPHSLAPADPAGQTRLLIALGGEAKALGVAATFEATHHGPQMDIPSMFVEVGSSPKDWQSQPLCAAVARAVVSGYLEEERVDAAPCAIGLGGGHYAPRHTDRARRQGTAFGHLIPGYALEGLDEAVLRRAAELSRATVAFVDSKNAPPQALERAVRAAEGLGLAVVHLGEQGPSVPNL
jgi:D-aminoacyl-tRNA deacylase